LANNIAFCKKRWQSYFPFDLDDDTWKSLTGTHPMGAVLQSIQLAHKFAGRKNPQ